MNTSTKSMTRRVYFVCAKFAGLKDLHHEIPSKIDPSLQKLRTWSLMRMIGRKGQQEEKVDNLFWDKLRFSLVQSFEIPKLFNWSNPKDFLANNLLLWSEWCPDLIKSWNLVHFSLLGCTLKRKSPSLIFLVYKTWTTTISMKDWDCGISKIFQRPDSPQIVILGQPELLQCCFKSLFTLFAGDQHLLHQPIISLESGVAMLSTSGVTSDMRWYQRV